MKFEESECYSCWNRIKSRWLMECWITGPDEALILCLALGGVEVNALKVRDCKLYERDRKLDFEGLFRQTK